LITEIPSADDFSTAAVSTLNLAWRMAIDADREYQDELSAAVYEVEDGQPPAELTDAAQEAVRRRHLERSQVSLGNALSLVQQAAELALKGRIAAVSPFLLIVRDPRDLPRDSGKRDVAFSEFRSIDAVDLVRVHDTFKAGPERLPHAFVSIWEELRKRRNSLMHSVSPGRAEITPEAVMAVVLWVNHFLLPSSPWPRRRLAEFFDADVEDVRPFHSGLTDYDYPISWVMHELAVAVSIVPAYVLRGAIGYEPDDRHYLCPWCSATANSEMFVNLEGGTPKLATVTGEKTLKVSCLVCEAAYPVERRTCQLEGCGGDISSIYRGTEGTCLTCGWDTQDLELRRSRQIEQRLRDEAGRDSEPYN
jgi:hypothetical protein